MARPTYRLTRDFIIPAGTEVGSPPTKSSRWGKDFEAIAAIDNDHTAFLTLNLDDGLYTGLVEKVGPKTPPLPDNVTKLIQAQGIGPGVELDANLVLEAAVGEVDHVVVVGVAKDGSLYVASTGGAENALAFMALAERHLLNEAAKLRGWE